MVFRHAGLPGDQPGSLFCRLSSVLLHWGCFNSAMASAHRLQLVGAMT